MYVVIFRAKIRHLDSEYTTTAARMRELAIDKFGCTKFISFTEGQDEIVISYWPDASSIRTWKAHPEHVLAQQAGCEKWYESYSVEVARIERQYKQDLHDTASNPTK